jgi:hypothetical protein
VSLTATGQYPPFTTQYTLNGGGSWRPYHEPFTIYDEGTTTVLAYSFDGTSTAGGVKGYVLIDKTPPTVTSNVDKLSAAANPTSAALRLAATDRLSGVATGGLTAQLDAGPSVTASSSNVLTFGSMALGPHVVSYSAADAAGNVATRQVDFVLRDTPAITPAATSLSASRKRGVATFKLRAVLRSANATPIANASVVLEQKSASGAWKQHGAALTADALGKLGQTVTSKKAGKTLWRWRSVETTTERQAVSSAITLKVR